MSGNTLPHWSPDFSAANIRRSREEGLLLAREAAERNAGFLAAREAMKKRIATEAEERSRQTRADAELRRNEDPRAEAPPPETALFELDEDTEISLR